jgi:hypothetical protein
MLTSGCKPSAGFDDAPSSPLGLGHLDFHLTVFIPVDLSPGVPLIENIERLFSRLLVESPVSSVAIAPVSDARKEEKDETEPEKPAPAKIPVVPITMSHFDSPSDKSNLFTRKSDQPHITQS